MSVPQCEVARILHRIHDLLTWIEIEGDWSHTVRAASDIARDIALSAPDRCRVEITTTEDNGFYLRWAGVETKLVVIVVAYADLLVGSAYTTDPAFTVVSRDKTYANVAVVLDWIQDMRKTILCEDERFAIARTV